MATRTDLADALWLLVTRWPRVSAVALSVLLVAEATDAQPLPPQLVSVSVTTVPVSSTPDGFWSGLLTDPTLVVTEPQTSKPAYLVPVSPAPFGVPIIRIANDPGLPTSPVAGVWGTDARHVYSKQQP